MAFFDQLGNLTPEQNQGLLAAAAQILQASGPSRTPTSIGQILGGGLQAYQQNLTEAEQRKIQRQQQQQQQQLLGLKIQDAQSDLANQAAARDRAARLQQFYQGQANPNPAAQLAPGQTANLAPTVENAQAFMTPKEAIGAANDLYSSRIAQAQALRAQGFGPEADAAELQALKFKEEFETKPQVGLDENGKPFQYVLGKGGTVKRLEGILPRDELKLADIGGQQVAYNSFQLTPGQSFAKTATPGELLIARTASNRLAFDKTQAGENGTGPLTQQAIDNAAKRYNFDGTLPSMGMGKSAAAGRSLILNRAAELAGGESATGGREEQLANKGNIASQSAAVKAFTSGKQGNTVRSFNTSVAHLDTLDQLASQLNNTNTPAFNKVANFYQQQTGNPAPTNFNAAKKIVGDEIVKAIVGAGGGVADREEAAKTIDAANSPAQLKNVIKTYQELMIGQLAGLEQQYKSSTNRNDFGNLLSARSKEIYQQAHGTPAGQQQKTATLADIAETARSSGRSTAEVTARLKALGYKIGGE